MNDRSAPPLPTASLLSAYYAVQFGKTVLWVAADLVAFYVLATIDRLPAEHISLVLMGGLAWHAVSDMAVGWWLERGGSDGRGIAIVAGASVPIACTAFVGSLLLAEGYPWASLSAMMISRSAYALFDVPHHVLIGRMGRMGWPTVRIVGIRNLWGQIASALLGLGLSPFLGPAMTDGALAATLIAIACVSAVMSLPIRFLVRELWTSIPADRQASRHSVPGLSVKIVAVLGLHLLATLMVASTNKVALAVVAPGTALAMLSAGRVVASLPLPERWREQHAGQKLISSALILAAAIGFVLAQPGPSTLFAFGVASGWINILTWSWLGQATDHPRPFGSAAMLTKIGLMASVPLAAALVRLR